MQRLLFLIDLVSIAFFIWLFAQIILWLKRNYFKTGSSEVEIARSRAEMMKALLNQITILPEKTFAQLGNSSGVLVAQTQDSNS